MKTFKKSFLPDTIEYNGYTYKMNPEASAKWMQSPHSWDSWNKYERDGLRPIMVEVMNPKLKGVNDLHGKPYQPSKFVFTISPDQIRWKVMFVFKTSARRVLIQSNLSREKARELCLSIQPTKFKSAHCFMQK